MLNESLVLVFSTDVVFSGLFSVSRMEVTFVVSGQIKLDIAYENCGKQPNEFVLVTVGVVG